MSLTTFLTKRFYKSMLETAEGRAYLLAQVADAEDNGEARIFDEALLAVDDPKLKKMIERHRDDEIRHGELFRTRMRAQGVDPGPVPDEVKILDRINAALGNFFDRPITDERGVMEAYLILQVVEERAIQQFQLGEPIWRDFDPETADVFAEVAKDEERHLRYCNAIARRYAPSEEVRQSRLQEIRRIEAVAFLENNQENTRIILERGLMSGRLNRVFWPLMTGLGRRAGMLPWTEFASEQDRAVAGPITGPIAQAS